MTNSEIKEKVKIFIVAFKDPVTIDFIERGLKLNYKQIKKALQSLRDEGIVTRTSKQHDKWVRR